MKALMQLDMYLGMLHLTQRQVQKREKTFLLETRGKVWVIPLISTEPSSTHAQCGLKIASLRKIDQSTAKSQITLPT